MLHIVLLPRHKKFLSNELIARRIKELFFECAEIHRWKIQEVNITSEYVHIAMELVLDESLSNIIGTLKFESSKVLKKEFSEINKVYRANSFWEKSFCANTGDELDMELFAEFFEQFA